MSLIKCKLCGGDIALSPGQSYGVCRYCGSVSTVPVRSDEKTMAKFNRGNQFRRSGEFDRALSLYESIVQEDDANAEAHWCCALCRFGIEYVEDPATFEYIPTCHRLSYDSFLEDVDYLAAVEHSQGVVRRQYQRDAFHIAQVQKQVLAGARNEKPYDIFICYKETDETGSRTLDSKIAQDMYYELTKLGYRVFFSRLTLEDKAGSEYEPIIFGALSSARVMIALGTKPEHFGAVWVKNEWSRFLAFMRRDRQKLLLPCYRDMDPYELPEQLAVFQSYDMGKIGFLQDLVRGIGKVLPKEQPNTAPAPIQETGCNIKALAARGKFALEDRNWKSAKDFFETVLNYDAACPEAHLGLALTAQEASSLVELKQKHLSPLGQLKPSLKEAFGENSELIQQTADACSPVFTEEEILQEFDFPRTVLSSVDGCKAILQRETEFWQRNPLMLRAFRFADDAIRDELTQTKQTILGAIRKRLAEEQQAEEAAIRKLKARYDQFLREVQARCINNAETSNKFNDDVPMWFLFTCIVLALAMLFPFLTQ